MSIRELTLEELVLVAGGEGEGNGGDQGGTGSNGGGNGQGGGASSNGGGGGYGFGGLGVGISTVSTVEPTVTVDKDGNVSLSCPPGYTLNATLDMNTGQVTDASCSPSEGGQSPGTPPGGEVSYGYQNGA